MTAPSTPVLPIIFGAAERQLFGIYYAPQSEMDPTRPAVLLCNPFGQEAIRAHRFLRTLAERLARAGHAVLRFDYFGTGDSMGNDSDGELDGWCMDLQSAHSELRRLSGANRVVWFGMRLGASVALRATRGAGEELKRLILWDPVLDGSRYLRFLRERHVASLLAAYILPQTPSPKDLAADAGNYCDEAIGFSLSPTLRAQLATLGPETDIWPQSQVQVVVVVDPDTEDGMELKALTNQPARQAKIYEVRHGTNWTADSAANTSLVPTAALLLIAQQVAETR